MATYARIPYLRLLADPVTQALWAGQLISAAGSRLTEMALLWLIYEATGSAAVMSAVALAEYVPVALVGLLGGPFIDRLPRLRTLATIDLVRAILVGSLPVLHWAGWLNPWTMSAVTMLLATLGALFNPALQSAVPGLVGPEHLRSAMGMLDITARLGRLAGPGLAGLLLAVVPMVHFFTLDAFSFVVSAAAFWFILHRTKSELSDRPGMPTIPTKGWREALAGWQWIRRDGFLSRALAVRALCNIAWAVYTLGAPILVKERFQEAGAWGLLIAAYGAANLVGNLYAGNFTGDSRRLYFLSWALNGIGFIGIGYAPTLPVAAAAAFVAGLSSPVVHVVLDTHIGRTVAPDSLGRVFAAQQLAVNGAGALGLSLAGWLLTHLPAGTGITLAGGFMIAASVAGLVLATATRHEGRAGAIAGTGG